MSVCQEVIFLAYSNLFVGFADCQREKISLMTAFFLPNKLAVAFPMVYQDKLLTLELKVSILIYEKERGSWFGN